MSGLIDVEELINKINDTYKGYMLEEQYSPLSFKNMVEELAEKTTINAIPIPRGVTNGDVFMPMFPDLKIEDNIGSVYMHDDNGIALIIDKKWLNAPYKGE